MKGRRPVRHSLQGNSMAEWHRGPVLKKERGHPTRGPVYHTPLTSWNGGHWNRCMPQQQEQVVQKNHLSRAHGDHTAKLAGHHAGRLPRSSYVANSCSEYSSEALLVLRDLGLWREYVHLT